MYRALALVLVYLERRKIFMLWCFWEKKAHACTPSEDTAGTPGWIRGGAGGMPPGVTGRADRSSEFKRAAASDE